MTNNTLFKIVFTLFLSILSLCAQAIDHLWIGGNGIWNDPNNWSTGLVPTLADDVYIYEGFVHLETNQNATARNITLRNQATLYTHKGSDLVLSGSVNKEAIYNEKSTIIINGDVLIDQVSSPNGSKGRGIYSTGNISIKSNGTLQIQNIDDQAIYNRAPGDFLNDGVLTILDAQSYGIFNSGIFENTNELSISGQSGNNRDGIMNLKVFKNHLSAVINISNGFKKGFVNNTNATLDNLGTMDINSVSNTGLVNYNITNNKGSITTSSCTSQGVYNRGEIYNDGLLFVTDAGNTGIYNTGIIENYQSLLVIMEGVMGIYVTTSGVIHNYREFAVNPGNILHGIFLRGHISNIGRGTMFLGDKLSVAGGKLINDGFLDSNYQGNHSIYGGGKITNEGAIDDNTNSFPSSLNNQQIIIKPIVGTMEVGQPYPDVLDIVSLSNVTLSSGDWRISPGSNVSAGTYDVNTNTFTPSAAAAGSNTLYFSIFKDGLSRSHSLEIPGGVLPAGSNYQQEESAPSIAKQQLTIGASQYSSDCSVFPNPTTGTIQISSEVFEKASTTIQVFNTLGQLVMQTQIDRGDLNPSIEFPTHLSNGNYVLHCIQNNQQIAVERIHLQR